MGGKVTKRSKSRQNASEEASQPFRVRWAVLVATEIGAASQEQANSVVEFLANKDLSLFELSDLKCEIERFKLLEPENPEPTNMIVDVRVRSGTTANKVSCKKSTALNTPEDDIKKIENLCNWFTTENTQFALPRHREWFTNYIDHYRRTGGLSKKQFNLLKGTKERIQSRARSKKFYMKAMIAQEELNYPKNGNLDLKKHTEM